MKKMTLSFVGLLCLFVLMSFTIPTKKKKKVASPEGYVYVPSGKLLEVNEATKKNEETQMEGYFMSVGEVTHLSYNEFLADLEKNSKTKQLEIARIQSEAWNEINYASAFVETYSTHPAYENYPVVNVSRAAAEMYCEWLGKKWEAQEKKPKGMEDVKLEFRLPTKKEWVYAARGGHDWAPFPWGGPYLRNGKGQILANYKRVPETSIKFNRETNEYEILNAKMNKKEIRMRLNDNAHITAPALSFIPNDYGLFNMSGNVSEMLDEGGTKGGSWGSTAYYITIDAEEEFPNLNGEASPMVGFRPVAIVKK